MTRKLTTTDFIKRARNIHGNKYSYEFAEYKTAKEKVHIVCPVHGSFLQDPFSHTKGVGCPLCGVTKSADTKRGAAEDFIKRARNIHGNKYSYEFAEYKTAKEKVIITCKVHGDFKQTVDSHLRGHGCPKCMSLNNSISMLLGTSEFIKRAKAVHGDTYSYDKVNYTGIDNPVDILCPIHGIFKQSPYVHCNGGGCRKCSRIQSAKKKTIDKEEILARFRCAHGDTYDYSMFEYSGTQRKSNFICRKHGLFKQTPEKHMEGSGCPVCGRNVSKAEDYIAKILSSYTNVIQRDRTVLGKKEIDILLPEHGIGIEYNGSYFHSEKHQEDPVYHLLNKQKLCKEKGITLLHVSDYDPIDVVIEIIKYKIQANTKVIYGRKCEVIRYDTVTKEIQNFLEQHHVQGGNISGTVYALTYLNKIVACMVFSNPSSIRGNTDTRIYELRRYASSGRIVGGAGKLLAAFKKDFTGRCHEIISYSDNRLFTGEMYNALGFNLVKEIPPDYKYTKGGVIRPKNHFKRALLPSITGFDFRLDETEHQNCLRNKWYRLYDCGKKKWSLKLKTPDQVS